MHPEIVSEEPGRCPICGMALIAQAAPTASYTCPMHPEIVSDQPGTCPICGMKLLPADLVRAAEQQHGHHDMHAHHGGGDHDAHHDHVPEHDAHVVHVVHDQQRHEDVHAGHEMHGHEGHGTRTMPDQAGHEMTVPGHLGHTASDRIEWEDDMVAVNRITTPANTRWKLVDRDTGASNHGILWRFRVGDLVKIRLVNEMDSDHPMHHPFHVHGAGRFLVLARDGARDESLAWKDTVLVRTGETVDILLEVTNPGTWMAHCHIAEHHESGMMLHFSVDA
jgi:FtsP/CotA-like multicopper oxidase with cupredoxin domain